MATIAIGDVHGNLGPLLDLLGQLEPVVGPGDTVVFLGDLIDRGPDSRGCVDAVLELTRASRAEVVALRGNHEDWMLGTLKDCCRHSWLIGMEAFPTIRSYSPAAAEILWKELQAFGPRLVTEKVPLPYEVFFDGVPPAHLDFFRSLPAFLRTPECVCVHGGIDPLGGPVEGQEDDTLIWGCEGFPDAYRGADSVVYGHADDPVVDNTGRPHPRIVGRTYGIDTISRGVLSAIRLPDLKVFQSRRHE